MLKTAIVCFLLLAEAPQDAPPSLDALINQLRSSQGEERERAERSLKLRGGDDTTAALEKAARDPDAEVAARARSILDARPHLRALTPNLAATIPGVREKLARDLRHSWTEVLLDAAEQTATQRKYPGILRDDLLPLASLAIRSAEPTERARVCSLVAGWRLTSAIPHLPPLLDDQDWNVKQAAMEAIESCRARELAPAVLNRLRAEQPDRRTIWINLLAQLGCRDVIPEITSVLLSPQAGFGGQELTWRLVELDAVEAVPALVKLLKSRRGEQTVYQALSQLAPQEARSTLLSMLDDPAPGVPEGALWTIRTYPSPTFVPSLLKLLRNPDSSVRLTALGALQRLASKEILPEIRKLLDDDSTPVRRAAALHLAGQGNKEGLPELAMLLRDPEAEKYAVYNAAIFVGRDAIPHLMELLKKPELQGLAARALGHLGAQEARGQLLDLLRSSNWEVRLEAAGGLVALDGKKAAPVLLELLQDPEGNVRYNVCRQMEDLAPDDLIAHFRKRFKTGAPQERQEAAQRLAIMGFEEFVPEVEQDLDATDLHARATAAGVLGGLGSKRSVPKLKVLLTDSQVYVRQQAARALAWLGERDGLPVLMQSSSQGPFIEINALRHPQVWQAWRTKILAGPPPTASPRELVEAVARQMNVAVEWSEAAEDPNAYIPGGYRSRGWTALSAVSQVGYSLGIVLEPDRIRVLSRTESRRFWVRWYADELLKAAREEERAEGRALLAELAAADRSRDERLKTGVLKPDPEAIRATLTSAIRTLPGVEERLVQGGDEVWTEVFLEVANTRLSKTEYRHLTSADLNPLVLRALRGALSPDDRNAVLQAVIRDNLKEALPLIAPLLNDSSDGVRASAAHALLIFEGMKAVPKVDRLFEDPSPLVRSGMVGAVAAARLKELVPRILSLKEDPAIRRGIAAHGEVLGIPETLSYIFEGLSDPEYHRRMQTMWAISALAGPEWNGALIAHMKQETDPQVLGILIRHFGQVGAREAVSEILAVMKRPQQFLPDHYLPDIIRTMGQLNAPEGTPVILNHLQPKRFLPEAARAAADMGLKESLPLLRAELETGNPHTAGAAAEALAILGDRQSLLKIRALLAHKELRVRGVASRSLAMMGDRESLPRMLEIARESGNWGGDGVAALLFFPGPETKAELLKLFGQARYLSLPTSWIDTLGEDLLPLVVERMKDESELSLLLDMLARLGTPSAVAAIRPVLAHRHEHSRFYAATSLCRVGDRESARYVLSHLSAASTRIPPVVLNAVRNPDLWKRLNGIAIPGGGYRSNKDHCERIAAAAGLKLEGLPPSDSEYSAWANTFVRLREWGQPPTALEALEQLWSWRWTVVLDNDRLRILGRGDAIKFWNEQLENEKR